jgi:colanic acid/amylovoran biosynthesis glycosyltransferase
MDTVLIFRSEILALSETFIQAQANSLQTFSPRMIGLRTIPLSLPLSPEPILLVRDNSLRSRLLTAAYRLTGFAPALNRAARRVHPQLIHAHFAPDGVCALPLARYLEVPLIVTLHGYDVTRFDEFAGNKLGDKIYIRRRKRLWSEASLFICVSEFIKERALAAGFPADKLLVHYIGVDADFFSTPQEKQIRQPTVLFVGRLVEKKGCNYLIEAMAEVQVRRPEAKLVVIGDGPERAALASQAKRLGVWCDFLGSQPTTTIRQWLWSARLFCVPSLAARNGDSEGLGMVFAEAQAAGVPVVSFSHGGIPEVVRHGDTGLLAKEGDARGLAIHLLTLLDNPDRWQEASEKASLWIRNGFNLQIQTRRLEEIYRNVLAGRRSA